MFNTKRMIEFNKNKKKKRKKIKNKSNPWYHSIRLCHRLIKMIFAQSLTLLKEDKKYEENFIILLMTRKKKTINSIIESYSISLLRFLIFRFKCIRRFHSTRIISLFSILYENI